MENTIEINGISYTRTDSIPANPKPGPLVIVRTFSAGVHIGEMDGEWTGGPVTLRNSRRLWRWRGANTLNEVATRGVVRSEYTRISEPVHSIRIEPIEIIPVADGLDFSEVWNG